MKSTFSSRATLRQRCAKALGSPWFMIVALVALSGCDTLNEGSTGAEAEPPAAPVQAVDNPPVRCPSTAKITVDPAKPKITVTYVEPTVSPDTGSQLAKTTIYIDSGKGGKKVMDVLASNPQGGGTISKSVGLRGKAGAKASVCVTATDTTGRESSPTQ